MNMNTLPDYLGMTQPARRLLCLDDLCPISFPDTSWVSSVSKDRNQGLRDRGIWEATPQDNADQSKPPEIDNPNTGALGDHNEVMLHRAGSKLGSHLLRLAGMGEFVLATCLNTFLH